MYKPSSMEGITIYQIHSLGPIGSQSAAQGKGLSRCEAIPCTCTALSTIYHTRNGMFADIGHGHIVCVGSVTVCVIS